MTFPDTWQYISLGRPSFGASKIDVSKITSLSTRLLQLVHRCMEQENTDFEFLESLQEMANEKVEVLQAAYEERPGEVVHHLVVSEDEVDPSYFQLACSSSSTVKAHQWRLML